MTTLGALFGILVLPCVFTYSNMPGPKCTYPANEVKVTFKTSNIGSIMGMTSTLYEMKGSLAMCAMECIKYAGGCGSFYFARDTCICTGNIESDGDNIIGSDFYTVHRCD